jgi:hypothetical protein
MESAGLFLKKGPTIGYKVLGNGPILACAMVQGHIGAYPC